LPGVHRQEKGGGVGGEGQNVKREKGQSCGLLTILCKKYLRGKGNNKRKVKQEGGGGFSGDVWRKNGGESQGWRIEGTFTLWGVWNRESGELLAWVTRREKKGSERNQELWEGGRSRGGGVCQVF